MLLAPPGQGRIYLPAGQTAGVLPVCGEIPDSSAVLGAVSTQLFGCCWRYLFSASIAAGRRLLLKNIYQPEVHHCSLWRLAQSRQDGSSARRHRVACAAGESDRRRDGARTARGRRRAWGAASAGRGITKADKTSQRAVHKHQTPIRSPCFALLSPSCPLLSRPPRTVGARPARGRLTW